MYNQNPRTQETQSVKPGIDPEKLDFYSPELRDLGQKCRIEDYNFTGEVSANETLLMTYMAKRLFAGLKSDKALEQLERILKHFPEDFKYMAYAMIAVETKQSLGGIGYKSLNAAQSYLDFYRPGSLSYLRT